MPVPLPDLIFKQAGQRNSNANRDNNSIQHWAKESCSLIQRLKLEKKLELHTGCVNTVCWDERGTRLLSGSDDRHLVISDPFTSRVHFRVRTAHTANIFSARWLPFSGGNKIVSCAGDGGVCYGEVDQPETFNSHVFSCHRRACYDVVTPPSDPDTFMSCSEDGTVRWVDLRRRSHCSAPDCRQDVLLDLGRPATSLVTSPLVPHELLVGGADGVVRLYDRRTLSPGPSQPPAGAGLVCTFSPPVVKGRGARVTSLSVCPRSREVLASYSGHGVYLFHPHQEQNHEEFEDSDIEEDDSTENGVEYRDDDGEPVRRLRLRGDWSDTGPSARTEAEPQAGPTPAMQRMSQMITRWLIRRREDDSSPPPPLRRPRPNDDDEDDDNFELFSDDEAGPSQGREADPPGNSAAASPSDVARSSSGDVGPGLSHDVTSGHSDDVINISSDGVAEGYSDATAKGSSNEVAKDSSEDTPTGVPDGVFASPCGDTSDDFSLDKGESAASLPVRADSTGVADVGSSQLSDGSSYVSRSVQAENNAGGTIDGIHLPSNVDSFPKRKVGQI